MISVGKLYTVFCDEPGCAAGFKQGGPEGVSQLIQLCRDIGWQVTQGKVFCPAHHREGR